jgi:site-specific DNA-methyltransferase (adenine-specific)
LICERQIGPYPCCSVVEGDCLELMKALPDGCVDAVITDPPYGIGRDGMRESTSRHGGRKAYEFGGWDSNAPSAEVFSRIFAVSRQQLIWGGNYFSQHLPAKMGWLVWDKGQRICSSDAELAFTSLDLALRVFTLNRVELMLDGAEHPTQKPLALMLWCIRQLDRAEEEHTILDPFCGSGTTLVAAKKLGRHFLGFEISAEYCAIARRRLAEIDAQPQLPFVKPEQVPLYG